jgi:hypothetical protein
MKLKLRNALYGSIGGMLGSVIASYRLHQDTSLPVVIEQAILVGLGIFILSAVIINAIPLFQRITSR